MKIYAFLILSCLLCPGAFAQDIVAFDGNWVRNGLDAYERVHVSHTGTDDDVEASLVLISYVSGMIAVHRQNNKVASLMVDAATAHPSGKPSKNSGGIPPLDEARLRTAKAFVPLYAIPDNLSPQQIVAVLRKYIDARPEKWTTNAPVLITEALGDAFSKK